MSKKHEKRKAPKPAKATAKLARKVAPDLRRDKDKAGLPDHMLDRLHAIIAARRDADPDESYTARLLLRGKEKIAQKLGEEAVETLIEGVRGDRPGVVMESADLLYHLLALWVSVGVRPDDVWAELARREGLSGLAVQAARRAVSA